MSIDAVIEEKDKDFSIYEVPLTSSKTRSTSDRRPIGLKPLEPRSRRLARIVRRLRNPQYEITLRWWASMPSITTPKIHLRSARPRGSPIGHRSVSAAFAAKTSRRKVRNGSFRVRRPVGARRLWRAGIEGKVEAIPLRTAERHAVPRHLLGMQCAMIEYARKRLQSRGSAFRRVRQARRARCARLLDEQKTITGKRGTNAVRCAANPTEPDSLAAKNYGATDISERHRPSL